VSSIKVLCDYVPIGDCDKVVHLDIFKLINLLMFISLQAILNFTVACKLPLRNLDIPITTR
jgi:hypothetical protein